MSGVGLKHTTFRALVLLWSSGDLIFVTLTDILRLVATLGIKPEVL
jgi:hypothetical protein